MKRPVPVLIALALTAAALPHGARAESVAVFTKNTTNPFSKAIRLGSDFAAKKLSISVSHYVPTTPDNAAEQAKLVEDAIAKKPDLVVFDTFALAGRWEVNPSEATVMRAGASLDFNVTGSKVFVVLSPRSRDDRVHVWLDGKPVIAGKNAGSDVKNGVMQVGMDNLYNVVDLQGKVQTHRLRLVFDTAGTEVFSFTFG